jgi:hypothetical protein
VTPAFYIRNHSSSELITESLETLQQHDARPSTLADKPAYRAWCVDETTDHVFFSLTEPRIPSLRPTKENPPQWLHGLVVDYDGQVSESMVKAFKPTSYSPAFITSTFSGGLRVIYVFEQKVPIFNQACGERFIEGLEKLLALNKHFPGLDRKALFDTCQFYELGTNWRAPFGAPIIPVSATMALIENASKRTDLGGDDIPLEIVAAEVAKRFPGRWHGDFVEGARGVRFWDPQADNESGAVVRKGGMQAFTGEGRFLPWSDIFGAEWVRTFNESRFAAAIENRFFDGRLYWYRDARDTWSSVNGDIMARHLNVKHGVSRDRKKGKPAEVDQCLTAIEDRNHVDGAFPFLFCPDILVESQGERLLNISRVAVMPPAPDSRNWGEDFPWIADYLGRIFPEDLDVFLSWLSRFYQNALKGKPKKGQALFIAGPAGAGKTFLSWRIIGGLMGGFSEATDYVLGNTTFNNSLFYKPVWTIDDAVAGADLRRHAVYSQIVKKIVANPNQQFHAKFKDAVTQRWDGRLVVTLNDDPESIAMLPNIDHSVLDKLVMLLACDAGIDFRGAEEIVARELPFFAAFIRDYRIPEILLTRPGEVARFGHDSFHHPDLINSARASSSTAGLAELLEMWRTEYFRANADETEWTGNTSALLVALQNTDNLRRLVDTTIPSRNALGRELQKLVQQDYDWVQFKRSNGKQFYVVKK